MVYKYLVISQQTNIITPQIIDRENPTINPYSNNLISLLTINQICHLNSIICKNLNRFLFFLFWRLKCRYNFPHCSTLPKSKYVNFHVHIKVTQQEWSVVISNKQVFLPCNLSQ